MIPVDVILTLAQAARLFAWLMTLFLAAAALSIMAFGAGDYDTVPDRQKAALVTLGLAILVVAIASVMGPIARRLAELRSRL